MKRICAWCKTDMGEVESQVFDQTVITHGICPACTKKVAQENSVSLDDYLNRLGVPVMLFESSDKVKTANQQACSVLGKEPQQISEKMPGDVIECIHARNQGGCGRQVHCKSCVIRKTVEETFATGRSFVRVPAFADIEQFDEEQAVCFEISTEKVGGIVLLRIDSVEEVSADA